MARSTRSQKTLPPWATALRVRRAELGKSQEAVALDSGILNQTTVSELEGGRYDIANLTAARLAGLARGLNWTLAEMEAALAVDFGLSGYASHAPESPRRGPPVPPPVSPIELPLEIPPGLQEVIDRHAKDYSELRKEKNLRTLTSARFYGGSGPQTADEWLDFFLANRRWLEK